VATLVTQVRSRTGRVVVNVGGRGAPGEPVDAINVNPEQFRPGEAFPNQVLAKGEQMQDLFPAGSVDEVTSRNLVGDINWDELARSAYYIVKPGARVALRPWGGQLGDIPAMEKAMQAAGFTNVARDVSPGSNIAWGVSGQRPAAMLRPGSPAQATPVMPGRPSVPTPSGPDTGTRGPQSVAP
jgi:hypothetical protein